MVVIRMASRLRTELDGAVVLAPGRQSVAAIHFGRPTRREPDAFARWSGARLPTEIEWEVASSDLPLIGNFADHLLSRQAAVHPAPAPADDVQPSRVYGDVWEWTSSSYGPYPGYRAPGGALGEYNGKFMCNQYVLRGGSCATSHSHIRPTYRNFFPPEARWQFSGIRLAK